MVFYSEGKKAKGLTASSAESIKKRPIHQSSFPRFHASLCSTTVIDPDTNLQFAVGKQCQIVVRKRLMLKPYTPHFLLISRTT